MPITAYTGLPGHGKSYTAVEHVILPALKQGRHVVTNVPLVAAEISRRHPAGVVDEFPLELIASEPERVFEYALPGSVVVVDEIWKLFPAGVKANHVPEPFKRWLAEHRHMSDDTGQSMQIVFVTQDLAQIAAFARQLVEQTFNTTKLTHLGFSSRYRIDVYDRGPTGAQMSKGKRRREILGSFSKSIFRCYTSHTLATGSTEHGANERAIDQRGLVWRSPLWWLGIPAAILCGWWGISQAAGFFTQSDAAPRAAIAAPGAVAPELKSDAVVSAPTHAPIAARAKPPRMAIVGYVHGESGGSAAIRSENGMVFVPWSQCWQAGDGLTRCAFDDWTVTELGVVD